MRSQIRGSSNLSPCGWVGLAKCFSEGLFDALNLGVSEFRECGGTLAFGQQPAISYEKGKEEGVVVVFGRGWILCFSPPPAGGWAGGVVWVGGGGGGAFLFDQERPRK